MAENMLTELELAAGAEYLEGLRSLGFEPEVLCWLMAVRADKVTADNHLAIVDTMLERIESRKIYDLLFKAYDSSSLTRQIDPFNVSLYGRHSAFGDALLAKIPKKLADREASPKDNRKAIDIITIDGSYGAAEYGIISAYREGIYVAKPLARSVSQDLARFQRFARKVDRMAA